MENIIIDVDNGKSVLIQEDGEKIRERRVFNVNEIMGANYWLMENSKIKFKLNANQMKIIKIAMAMVNPKEQVDINKPLISYTFTVNKLLEVIGVNNKRIRFEDVPDFLKELTASDNFSYNNEKGQLVLIHMFDKVIYKPEKQEVTFRFSWSMIEDFLTIENKKDGDWQSYRLGDIITFQSDYSMNIYGLCKVKLKGAKEKLFEIDIPDLRVHCATLDPKEPGKQKYKRYFDFKLNVIDRAFDEINGAKDTDIKISYTERKKGRSVKSLLIKVENLKYETKTITELEPPSDEVAESSDTKNNESNSQVEECAVGDSAYVEVDYVEVKEKEVEKKPRKKSKNKEIREEDLTEEQREIVNKLRSIIIVPDGVEKLPTISSLLSIYKSAKGDFDYIKQQYEIALASVKEIKDLGALVHKSVIQGYKMSKNNSSFNSVSKKNNSTFNAFEGRNYTSEQLQQIEWKLLGWDKTEK